MVIGPQAKLVNLTRPPCRTINVHMRPTTAILSNLQAPRVRSPKGHRHEVDVPV